MKLIKKIFFLGQKLAYKYLRLEIRPIPKNPSGKIPKTKALHIDFVGLSGVGKTTLYQALKKTGSRSWHSSKSFRSIHLSQIERSDLLNDPIYQKLAELKIKKNTQDWNINALTKLYMLNFFWDRLFTDFLITKYNKDYTVISEDGALHNFGVEIYSILENQPEILSDFLKNRAVVFVQAPIEQIVKQIKKRYEKENRLSPQHMGKTDDELVKITQEKTEQIKSSVKLLEEKGIPILYIDNSKSIIENAKEVTNFINKLQSK